MARLPTPGSDYDTWGDVLNDFLAQSHNADGTLKGGAVGDSQIQPGSINNAHISSSAVIDVSKLSGLGDAATKNTGTTSGTVAAGDDARLALDLGDPATATSASIQAVIDSAAGRPIVGRPGTYTLSSGLTIPSGTKLMGAGAGVTIFQVPAGATFRVFDIDGKTNVELRGFSVTKASGAAASGTAYGISVRGASTDILLERISVDLLVRGANIAGGEGTTPGTCMRITLREVSGLNSPTNFGINIDDSDGITLDTCYGRGNWLDGFKLRKKTKNVTVIGGVYSGNGVSGAGDGADCYAGGDQFSIFGTVFANNTGSGLTVKTGNLNQTDSANYGFVRHVDLIGLRCVGNTSMGAYVTVSDPLDNTEPLVSGVTVTGGYFAENGTDGLYLNGRNITVGGAKCRRNNRYGIHVAARALDVSLNGCISLANGTGAGTGQGIVILGKRVTVTGGTVLGVDANTVAVDSDYSSLTKYHARNIYVDSVASDVLIRDVMEDYNSTAQGIFCGMTTGICIIHQKDAGNPNSSGAYGSIGSTWIRTDATGTDVAYEKTSGAPNAATTGWSRRIQGSTATASLDFGSIAAGSTATLTVATGAASNVATTDSIVATPPSNLPGGLIIKSWVSASNTASIELYNATAGAIDPPSGTWRITVLKT